MENDGDQLDCLFALKAVSFLLVRPQRRLVSSICYNTVSILLFLCVVQCGGNIFLRYTDFKPVKHYVTVTPYYLCICTKKL